MGSNQRLIVIVGLVVVCALGFVVAKASEDNSDDQIAPEASITAPAAQSPTAAARTARGMVAPEGATAPGGAAAAPAIPRIVVSGLEPEGGVKELVFRKGDTIRFTVESDEPEEVHLHGYDVARDVAPGQPARFAVKASIEGIFEVELEHSAIPIAAITVEP